jgi:histidinol phosphatase-like enzyme (inositol monophosphatase family)
MLSDTDIAALTDLACRLADAAGAACLPFFRTRDLGADDKGGAGAFDPVTAADRAAEAAIRAILAAERPADGVLGEEEAPTAGTSGLTWVIDPIDGTRAFISGLPTWGVLVGLDDGADVRIGVIDQPHIGERFVGVKAPAGPRAWLAFRGQSHAMRTRPCPALDRATLYTTSPQMFGPREWEGFRAVQSRVRLARYGVDCYAYALVALGHVDLVIESDLQPFDIAAPKAVIEAAGGMVTDWRGGDCRGGGQVIAAGDARVHAEALAILRGYAG